MKPDYNEYHDPKPQFEIGNEIAKANAEYSKLASISNVRVLQVRRFIEEELSETERQVLFRLLGLHQTEIIADIKVNR